MAKKHDKRKAQYAQRDKEKQRRANAKERKRIRHAN